MEVKNQEIRFGLWRNVYGSLYSCQPATALCGWAKVR